MNDNKLKSAAEWAPSLPSTGDGYEFSDEGLRSLVRAIQADALEAAARVCDKGNDDSATQQWSADTIRALKPTAVQ